MGILSNVATRLYHHLVGAHFANDLQIALQLEARKEAVAYIKAHMQTAVICQDKPALHRLAFDHVSLEGLVLEFGVKSGTTIKGIAAMTSKPVHGFDSFEGLPEDWAGTEMRKGRFSTRGVLPKVPANVTLHPGWFDATLPDFVRQQRGPVAFVHVDSDLYSSATTILTALAHWLVPGTVIVFDEYFNFPAWELHEYKAFREFVTAHQVAYDYLGFTRREGAVAVKIRAKGQA